MREIYETSLEPDSIKNSQDGVNQPNRIDTFLLETRRGPLADPWQFSVYTTALAVAAPDL